MKVKDLITLLLEYDMEHEVFIGLGATAIPDGGSHIHSTQEHRPVNCRHGVYIIPTDNLVDGDKERT